jgi:hypothetical protein
MLVEYGSGVQHRQHDSQMRVVEQGQRIASRLLERVFSHQLLCHRLEGHSRERGEGQLHGAKGTCKGVRHGRVLSLFLWEDLHRSSFHWVTLPRMRNQLVWDPVGVLPISRQFRLEGLVFPLGTEPQEPYRHTRWYECPV